MRSASLLVAMIPVALLAAACVPGMQRPVNPPAVLSTTWRDDRPAAAASAAAAAAGDFWNGFGDRAIPAFVDRVRAANASVEAAVARVAQARGQARIAGAALLPTVGARANASATRTDNTNTALFSYSVGEAGLDIAYDVDLFGGARAGKRAAQARARATAYDAEATALVVETDAVRGLVEWSALADRIQVAERTVARAHDLLRILGVQLREGVATRVDLGLQSGEVARLEAQRSSLVEARRRRAAAIAVLVGEEAPRFTPPPLAFAALRAPAIDAGQPGDLLFRRPDVRAAEARIAAARGDVAQARAAFLPSLRLTGSGLVQAAAIGGPFGATLSAGAGLIAPIFQGGRLRGQYQVATAAQVESLALYRGALLQALAEADQALAGVSEARRRVAIYAAASHDAQEASRLARIQFLEGAIALDRLIDTERNEVQTKDADLVARQELLLATIDLYKALGGDPAGRGAESPRPRDGGPLGGVSRGRAANGPGAPR